MELKNFFHNKSWKKWDKSQWTVVILAGILLMVVAIPTESKNKEPPVETVGQETADSDSRENYARELEGRLEQVLSKIQGAGRVEVMVILEDYGESVVEKDMDRNTSQNVQGGENASGSTQKSEEINVETVYQDKEEGKSPFVGSEKTPKIAGVLVVAQGADVTSVKQNISEAVMALFQIDVNRIKVVKMNNQEEKQ